MAYNIPEVIRRILTNSPFFPQYFVVDGGVPAYPPGDGPDGTVGKPFRSIQDALNAAPAVDPFSPLTWFLTLRIMPGVYDEDVVVTRYGIVGFQTEGLVFIGDPGVSGIPGPPRNLIWRIDAPPGPPPLDLAFLYTSSSVMPWDGSEFSGFGVGTLTITGNVLVEGDSQIANAEARGLLLSSCSVYGNPAPQAPDGYAFAFSILELNGVVGTFLPGNVVTSVPSACTGTVISWEPTGPGTGYLEMRRTAGPATGFAAGDVVTFGPNSGTVVPAGVTIAGGVLGNDGSINDIAGTHKALGNGLGVALHRTTVGQDTGGPRFGSVIFPLIPAVTNLGLLLHKSSTERDVINEGPWGAGPPFEPLTRIEAEDSKIGGRVSVPTGMIKFEGMKAGGWNMPVGHDFKTYEYIRTSSIAGPISITGAVADFQDVYHPVIDSVIEGPVTVLPGVFQVDRVTEYYSSTYSVLPPGTLIIETGGGGGGSVGPFTDLTDVPHSYAGEGGKFVRVNGAESGLEFTGSVGGAVAFTDLTDVPHSYAGQAGKSPRVNATENGLEFFSAGGGSAEHGVITAPGGTWQFPVSWVTPLSSYTPVWGIDGNYTSWVGSIGSTGFYIHTSTILPAGKHIYWAALAAAATALNFVVDCAWVYAGPTPQTFTTPSNFIPGSALVYFNGQRLKLGALNDYTEPSANVIQFNAAVIYTPGVDEVVIDYLEA